ncbi:hypothetical protein RND71_039882 [Anisodus tanguticus]|uniref:Uncharacterized protein n=1 Tax=Anisodus tanguticus TaxID=243964 RepID=A0AAE1UVR2_9SOLA|nr:hypothetical protein RND71_039882 [Anisodus tanguticus]
MADNDKGSMYYCFYKALSVHFGQEKLMLFPFLAQLTAEPPPPPPKFYGKHMYSQEELDDIRVEWGLHFSKILAETEVGKLNVDK